VGVHALALGTAVALPAEAAWAIGGVALNHLLLAAAGMWPRSTWLGPNLRRLPAAAAHLGQVALTFDDGPDPEVTPRVLDLLDAAAVRATFFLIAARARRQPALVREIVARGHALANHSNSHAHHFALLGPRALAREIDEAQQVLAELGGRLPQCFRAPAGLRSPFLDPVLHRLNLHLVSWTRRGFDTRDREAARVLARLTLGLAGGDILLLHDGGVGDGRRGAGRPVVLDVLPPLLAQLRERQLGAVTLDDAVPPRHPPGAAVAAARPWDVPGEAAR
jgi:peptidoglycan/xylan/chitin deacetylase (PgdA/CDA1 family)